MDSLPVDAVLGDVREHLDRHCNLVLSAPPGSGKTTRVPPALLGTHWMGSQGSLLVLEPRRVAARAAARHMARQLGERVGERVGYQVRFENEIGPATRIRVITDGVLVRRLQSDPELDGIAGIVFDEFHERSLETDLGLALALDVQRSLRPDLRLIVMSATMDAAPVIALLGDARLIEAHGKQHPLTIEHRDAAPREALARVLSRTVADAMDAHPGDALVFVPGAREIRDTLAAIDAEPRLGGIRALPLHGELSATAQDRALVPDAVGTRRIVVATNIAESALTIDGTRVVVDSGLARRPRFDPNTGLSRLETVTISRASATQRAGRAARQAAGLCVRLWSAHEHALRAANDPPAIVDSDLCPLALELALWGVSDPAALPWLDAPAAGAFASAQALLGALGALDDAGALTSRGREMAALPLHPRLAAVVLAGKQRRAGRLACDLAAIVEGPRSRQLEREAGSDLALARESLVVTRRHGRQRRARERDAIALIERLADDIARRARVSRSERDADRGVEAGTLLLAGYPDRVAHARSGRFGEYRLASGRAARLDARDPLGKHELLVVPDLDAGGRDGRIHHAAAIRLEDVHEIAGRLIEHRDQLVISDDGRVRARLEERLGALVLSRRDHEPDDAARVVDVLIAHVRAHGMACLPWTGAANALRARMGCMARWCPHADWPPVDDASLAAELEVWLAPWITDARSVRDLARLDLCAVLRTMLGHARTRELDRLAPREIEVPSGSRIRLAYRIGEPPVLEVKLQEMFGLEDTPRVCDGRVPVMVHLLSPAGRPVQITQDLAGFWRSGYAEVRRELRGRYPKHPWPDDPMSATPTRRTRTRRAPR